MVLDLRDNLDDLTITGIFDLTDSGLVTSNGHLTASGNLNGAPVDTMAYLAIQFNSFNPAQITANGAINSNGDLVGLGTNYVTASVIIGDDPVGVAVTYQELLDGSAGATGGVPTDFTNYVYVAYQSVYNSNLQSIFLDRIDGNGTTFTTNTIVSGGATTHSINTVVVPQI